MNESGKNREKNEKHGFNYRGMKRRT